jgi:hypothetical protein
MNIKPGSVLRASGGYLVINMIDLMEEAGECWHTLKRFNRLMLILIK